MRKRNASRFCFEILLKRLISRPGRRHRPLPTAENPGGYLGRTSIMELLPVSDSLRRLVMQHATAGELQKLAVAEGMRTMYQDGLLKCLRGVTSVEEVLRVTQEA